MWDYDKLFAEGNIVGFKHSDEDQIHPYIIYEKNDCMEYFNDSLCYKSKNSISEIQYIIRLDEHGNVVEKLFDRDRDMPRLMPELEDGMFIRVMFKNNPYDQALGFINLKRGQIVYQDGGYDLISNVNHWMKTKIVEVYAPEVMSFTSCKYNKPIWRDIEYQAYLDSKVNL